MAVFVVYWHQDIGEPQESPVDPWLVEFENQQKAIEHLEIDGYRKWKDRNVYFDSFHHIKTFAKILTSRKAREPRTDHYHGSVISH